MASKKLIRITHIPSSELIAEGSLGWDITSFENNYYISSKCLKTSGFKSRGTPGFCIYKFIYMWMDFHYYDPISKSKKKDDFLGWKYIFPNPLLPFIWFRIAVPAQHLNLKVEIVSL